MVVFPFATKRYSFTPGWDQLQGRPLQAATVTSGDTDPVLSGEQLKLRKWFCRHQPFIPSGAVTGVSGEIVSQVVPF
ncbi:hypothetical protein RLOC_00008006 [Lonchura striata]|uniref:Uncharacterized protein n=1 Tax=Lonchura striata TaxID=40157 RepID=A0A218V2M4_9PASE|nr:hypothetical protein RLOC_00008006 [Lonchura striata domestica]